MPAILNDVQVTGGRRMIVATVEGHRFQFPEAWAMGYCRTFPGTDARDAAGAWFDQMQMEWTYQAQRRSA